MFVSHTQLLVSTGEYLHSVRISKGSGLKSVELDIISPAGERQCVGLEVDLSSDDFSGGRCLFYPLTEEKFLLFFNRLCELLCLSVSSQS